MKLIDDPELPRNLAVLIPKVNPKSLQVEYTVIDRTGYQIEQVSSKETSGDPLAVILRHIIKGVPHLLMDGRNISPEVVDP